MVHYPQTAFFLQNYSFSGALSIMVEDQMKVHFKSSLYVVQLVQG